MTDWEAWVRQWAGDIDAAASSLMATFEASYGYPPGANLVRWAADDDLEPEAHPEAPTPLTGFSRVVAEVRLPDVANGIFIHRAAGAYPHGLLIGSTGGGTQFVIDGTGRVQRSIGASLEGDFKPVADSLEQFLTEVRFAVTEFVSHNRIVGLDNW
ncbi:hypothetical protein [Paractinoplanes lichenicola]|uniref:SMI1/KNR4 family protein n=1 Tax=Paractinoplanes lichenicola TaxID=2802976 RepID=A0ABS1VH66_9ACTN|nr:hypothetical protein [Actinoplanes lichenicola]MBL7254034.1 hypothetical protein [Actinoplanes lichenicola]